MKIEQVKTIGIVGAGTMGHGISQACVMKDYSVLLLDISEEILEKALKLVRDGPFGLMRLVEKGRLDSTNASQAIKRIRTTTDMDYFSGQVDFIIEAVPEDPRLKKRILGDLDEKCSDQIILASNTSSIMITELSAALNRKDRFIGMHWFNPPPVMPLIEIIRGSLTSNETLQLTIDLSEKLDKIPIEAKDGPGFYTTRFITAYLFEAIRLFEEGVADMRGIDHMTKLAFNHPMGPFELMDLIGLDTMLHIGEYIYGLTRERQYKPPLLLRKLVLSGYTGTKKLKPASRGGWQDYLKGDNHEI